MEDRRPVCSYGTACFRRNPYHFRQLTHPHRKFLLSITKLCTLHAVWTVIAYTRCSLFGPIKVSLLVSTCRNIIIIIKLVVVFSLFYTKAALPFINSSSRCIFLILLSYLPIFLFLLMLGYNCSLFYLFFVELNH